VFGLIVRGRPNMKNSASTSAASNAGLTPTCVDRDEVGIGAHYVRGLIEPKKPLRNRAQNTKQAKPSAKKTADEFRNKHAHVISGKLYD